MRKDSLRKRDEILGKEFDTKTCGKCIVIEYLNTNKVIVKFYDPEAFVNCSYSALKNGHVKNPLFPTFRGKGFIGVGRFSAKDTRLFYLWTSMLYRGCVNGVALSQPSYKDVEVCDEWLDFQNFAEWCVRQKGFYAKDAVGKSYQLDKDILVRGNKVYSPETCCFVPARVNSILINCKRARGEYLVGVSFHKRRNKFTATYNYFGKLTHIGSFDTEVQAFQAYKQAKELYIKEVVRDYKESLCSIVYQTLINWEIGADD